MVLTASVVLPIRARRRQGSLGGLLGSLLAGLLLLGGLPLQPVRAAELLEIQLDGLQLPLDLEELQAWSKDPSRPRGDLGAWFDLLAPHHREGLLRLLRAPLVRDRSMAQQLLQSWVGQRLLASMGGLFSTEKGNAGPLLYATLSDLLLRQRFAGEGIGRVRQRLRRGGGGDRGYRGFGSSCGFFYHNMPSGVPASSGH